MIQFLLGFVGIAGVVGLAFLLLHPAGQRLLAWGMRFTIPLLVAALVMIGASGFLIWKWTGAVEGRKVAERQVKQVTGERDTAKADLLACQTSRQNLTAALEAQNAAVLQLGEERDAALARGNAAMRKAEQLNKKYRTQMARITAAESGPDQCASAASLIRDTLGAER